MLFPLKLKLESKFSLLDLGSIDEQKRVEAVTKIRLGKVYKTTSEGRFVLTADFLRSHKKAFMNVHDIGSSDGTASLLLMNSLCFKNYFCLDKDIFLKVVTTTFGNFLVDQEDNIHMFENRFFYLYLDPFQKQKSPWERIFSMLCKQVNLTNYDYTNFRVVNPEAEKKQGVQFKIFDIFKDDLVEKSDLLIIFNLLNKFNDQHSIKKISSFIRGNLSSDGLIIIGENDPLERATFYKLCKDKFKVIKKINGGTKFLL